MKKNVNINGEITKFEKNDDGTLTVCGYASAEVVDSDGEIITAEAMRKAVENYMKFGAVREMHGSNAAGVTVHAEVQADGRTYVEVLVVDSEAVKKCEYKVYKAFSIGGRVKKRNGKVIEEIDWVELSLVDRPANPEAVFTAFKADMLETDDETLVPAEVVENIHAGETLVPSVAVVDEPQSITDVPVVNTPAEIVEQPEQLNVQGIEVTTENGQVTINVTPQAEKTETVEPQAEVKKSLSDVGYMASILNELRWLHESLQCEANWEGDNSPIPDELKAVIISLAGILNKLVVEESAEAVANLTNSEKSIILGNNNDDILKAGQRNSKSDLEAIQKIHDLALQLGAISPSNIQAVKSEGTEDLNKAEALQKSLDEAVAKAQKLESDNEALNKRNKELEAMPKPRKGVLSIFAKSDDVLNTQDEVKVEPILKTDGTIDVEATAIKKSLIARLKV